MAPFSIAPLAACMRGARVAFVGAASAATFWEELRRELEPLTRTFDAEVPTTTARPASQVLELSAWQRFCSHFTLSPQLLSKPEAARIFQTHSLYEPPFALLSLPQFVSAIVGRMRYTSVHTGAVFKQYLTNTGRS